MKRYLVTVRNPDGAVSVLPIDAESPQDAFDIAGMRGRMPVEAVEDKDTAGVGLSWLWRGVPIQELFHFTRLFATLTRAGIPILEALDLLLSRASHRRLQEALIDIASGLRSGQGLREAFGRHDDIFDMAYLGLIEVGQESGKLPQVLDRQAQVLKKRMQLRSMVIKAMAYPMLVMVISTVVVAAIMIFLVPRFKEIYGRFGGELPGITMFTIACSDFLVAYTAWLVAAVFGCSVVVHLARRTVTGKRLYDQAALSVPLFGPMLHTYELAGFAKSFAMLVHSGVTVTGALDLTISAIDRVPIREALRGANEMIVNGRTLSESFDAQFPWLPALLTRMVEVGERTGNLSEILEHVAGYYEEEFNNQVETLASLIEPALIIGLGVVIGVIVISLYLPIFGLAKLIVH